MLGTVAAILMAFLSAARIASGQPCVTIFGIGGCGPGVEFDLDWDPATFVQGVLVILSMALLILAAWLRTLRR